MERPTIDSEIALRIKCRKGTNIRIKIDRETPLTDFVAQLEALTDVPSKSLILLKDYPPKKLYYDKFKGTVGELGLKPQDTLIVEADANALEAPLPEHQHRQLGVEGPSSISHSGDSFRSVCSVALSASGENNSLPLGGSEIVATDGILLRHVVPSDNCCLFSSIVFCLGDQEPMLSNTYLRTVIADTVRGNPEKFDHVFLGHKNEEYSSWIQKPESWGGAIEIAILSERYHCEIVVVNIQSATLSRFGEDKGYNQCILLLYDGIHYDPLYLEKPLMQQKVFPGSDPHIYAMAIQLAQEAKAAHQFTDLKNFSLKCTICGIYLKGQTEAQSHAKITQHTDFSEVNAACMRFEIF